MKLDKAIEILEHLVTYRDCFDNTERYHAIKLGIEALKRLQDIRDDPRGIWVYPLPGETREEVSNEVSGLSKD